MEHTRHIVEPTSSSGALPALHIVSPDARIAAGKALRDKIPREQHGRWSGVRGRPNPIDLLHKSDAGRMKELLAIRYGRMLPSPFTYYRGAAGVMAADLARTPTSGLKVQACGDCHLLNFGGFATPERSIIFDINDFDETLPAPWEWDVKRLVASTCSPPDRTDCPITTGAIAPSVVPACTANTCASSPGWTRSEFGMQKPVRLTLSTHCRKHCRNRSRNKVSWLGRRTSPHLRPAAADLPSEECQ